MKPDPICPCCERPFSPRYDAGRPPTYCSVECRDAVAEARRLAERDRRAAERLRERGWTVTEPAGLDRPVLAR